MWGRRGVRVRARVCAGACGREKGVRRGSLCHLSPSCGSSKQPSPARLRGCCLTSQAENGPCPLLPRCISFPSCLSLVMDTACNKKSQHIYGVADPRLHTALLSTRAERKNTSVTPGALRRFSRPAVAGFFPDGTQIRPSGGVEGAAGQICFLPARPLSDIL